MSDHKIYLYPKWVRLWHGINALSIIILIASGVSMQYSAIEYPVLQFDMSVFLHNIFAGIIVVSYLFFVVSNLLTENGNSYRLKRKGLFKQLIAQSKYYLLGYFKGDAKPFPISKENKFNPLQRLTYTITMYVLVPLVIISGIGMFFPDIILEKFMMASGIEITAIFHSALGFLISLFLIVHIYIASIGKHPLRNYRSIVTGYHED